jgi:hypothetical protein
MKRWLATVLLLAFLSTIVRADVTVVQTIAMEGAAMAMGGAPASSTMTSRVKGMKGRLELDAGGQTMVTIADVVARQVTLLRSEDKTAKSLTDGAAPVDLPAGAKIEAAAKASGKSQTIDGLKCEEYVFTATMNLADVAGRQMPPEMAAMAKDLTVALTGSIWVATDAPGAAEFVAYQKAVAKADLVKVISGGKVPGLDRMIKAISSVDGIAYLTETNIAIDGTGPMADMLRQTGLGTMKVAIKTTSISVDALSDDLFKVPEGYTVVK